KGKKEAKQEKKAAPSPKAKKTEGKGKEQQPSTEMTAKEAIEYIKNTAPNQLKGFVTDNEERVTVLKAWQEKQEKKVCFNIDLQAINLYKKLISKKNLSFLSSC